MRDERRGEKRSVLKLQAAFRETVRSFIKSNCPKSKTDSDADPEESGWSKEARAKTEGWRSALAENGWIAPAWPKEYGGAGLLINEQFILNEELPENGHRPSGMNEYGLIPLVKVSLCVEYK